MTQADSAPVERKQAQRDQVAFVDGWPINIANEASAIARIVESARRSESFSVFTLNLDHLVKLRASASFRAAYSKARYITADGAPIAKLAQRQWHPVSRTTGADLFLPLCKAAAEYELPVYLFGTSDDVLKKCVAYLQHHTQARLRIVGAEAPDRGFDPEGPAAEAAIRRIQQSGARLCFVMLGAPKQELFAARAVEFGVETGFVCVGAAADFIAGHQVRAPSLLRSLDLEWLWRLASNPRRLAKRYLSCALILALIKLDERGKDEHPAHGSLQLGSRN